jgi:glutamate transport system substrate-binding protein
MLATALVITMPSLAGCPGADVEPEPSEYLSGEVLIGINTDLPGWSEYSNGVWQGFDIALGRWLGDELGFDVRYVNLTTNERISALEADGEIKLVISNFSITDNRRETIDMVGPYFTDSQGILTLKTKPIAGRKDLVDKSVCVPLGSTTELRLGDMTVVATPENTLQRCMERLRAGEVDAVSSDRVILEGFIVHGGDDLTLAQNIRVGSERYGIGIPNNRPKLCEYLRDKLSKFIDDKWDQTLRDALPGVDPKDRKPNSAALDPCEKPATE